MTTQVRRHAQLPPIVAVPMDNHVWEVVVPIARTNLISNPSFETNTTGWVAEASSIARTTTYQYHGAYSLQVTPTATTTAGASYIVSVPSGLLAYSIKFLGQAGLKYRLTCETTGYVELVAREFIATGRWQWQWLYANESAPVSRKLIVRKNNQANLTPFYIDGAQVEAINAGETVSTYLDGDQLGLVPNQSPPAYFWNGTPHASTSGRSGLTRAGGMVFRFKDFGFFLTAIIGLGLAGAQNVATEYARIDGGFDDYTRKPIRQFTITGNFQDASHLQLRADRGTLASYLDRDLASLDQQLVLRHHLEDQCGNIQSDAVLLPCKYVQGLEGNVGSYYGETVPLSFVQYLPVIQAEGEAGAALAVQATVTNANNLLRRSPSGTWSAMSTGTSGGVNLINAILQHPNGYVYVGGDFLSAGSSGADYMARYDPATDTFANIAGSDTTFNGAIYALCRHQDGRIVVAGTFTNAAANPSADAIVTLDPTANTISALGTGANAVVLSCAVDNSGRIFGGANFATDFGAIANSNGIAYWDGAAWNAMGTGLGSGNAYAILPLGNRIYIGGDFGSVSGVANTAKIAYWDFGDSAWHSVTSGTFTGTSIFALAKLPNGNILIVGSFSVIGGVSAANVAIYNGVSFTPIGSGINGSGVWGTIDPISGTAWVSGNASTTTADGITIASPYAKVVGGALRGIDVDLPGTPNGLALAFGSDGTQYLGYDTTGSATVPGTTTVTNTGTARSYPVITIKGPSSGTARIYQITNYTTGRAIYLNLTISAGETVVMNFRPDALSFTSDFVPSGNVAGTILPGSNEADFFLQPGANVISFFSASSSVTATIRWRPAFASLDGVQ